ncbi:MAG: response regulator [Ramlibacter sp.]
MRVTAPRILVVDDDRDYVETMSLLLQASGYRVQTACNGERALEALREEETAVVLTDLAMPVLDGYRLLAAIRAEPVCREALVVAISGWGGRETPMRCSDAGFDAYFVKPCDPRDLMWTIAAGLARQPRPGGRAGTPRD